MKRVLSNIVILICLIVFVVCAYKLVDYFYGNMESESQFDNQRDMVADVVDYKDRLPEYEKMKEENEDFVGWVIADGTNVNYPMMQTVDDPDFYLDHNFKKEKSKPGTIFISNAADLYEPTDVVTIFGHNMRDDTMFGSLDRYDDEEFIKEHDRVWVDSLDGRREFQVTHVMRIRVDVEGKEDVFPYYAYSNFEDKEDFNEFIKQAQEHSLYDTGREVKYGDKFVILSTCEYTYGDGSGRLVIMGKEVEPEKDKEIVPEITKPMMGTYVMIGIAVAGLLIIIMLIVSFVKGHNRRKRAKAAQTE